MRAQAILFDKDGTLFDFQKTWAGWISKIIRDQAGGDKSFAERFARAVGFDLSRNLFLPESVVIAGTARQSAGVMAPFFPGRTVDDILERFDHSVTNVVPVPVLPLIPFIDRLLAGGQKIGIATNGSEASARSQLAGFEISQKFHFIAGYDSGFGAKPEPGMCTAFCRSVSTSPEKTVMVGDSLHDLHAGRAAGMQTVAVLTGVASAPDLAPHADVVLPDIGHLHDWLAS
ncbi:MAG: HAD family hydrolase [Marinosulfonomonas sp.]|nr:HAD family hydrolase [Marinosulfonomonas sp.]